MSSLWHPDDVPRLEPVAPSAASDAEVGAGLSRIPRAFVVAMHRLPRLFTAHPERFARVSALVGGCLVFLYYLPWLVDGEWGMLWRNAWLHAWVLAWLLLVSFLPRTVSLTTVAAYWLVGFFLSVGVTFAIAEPVEQLIGSGNFQTAFLVPIVEEALKAAPLLGYVFLAGRRRVPEPTVMDLLILGFAVGAGFGIHEEALWLRSVASGMEGGGLLAWLFPTMMRRSTQFVVAHGVWTAFVGLGFGIFAVYRHLFRAWIVPLVALVLAIVDHAAVNFRGFDLQVIMMGGRLLAWLMVGGLILALLHDHWIWWRAERRDEETPPLRLGWLTAGEGGLAARLRRVGAALAYHRQRQGAHVTLWRERRLLDREPVRLPRVASQLAGLRGRLEGTAG